jgi:hypothetical protein
MLGHTFALGPAARFVPQVVVTLTLALLLAEGIRQVAAIVRERQPIGPSAPADPREWRALAWVAAIVLLIALIGTAAGLAVTMMAYLRLESRVSWPASVLSGAGVALGVELMHRGLGVPLPRPLAMF